MVQVQKRAAFCPCRNHEEPTLGLAPREVGPVGQSIGSSGIVGVV